MHLIQRHEFYANSDLQKKKSLSVHANSHLQKKTNLFPTSCTKNALCLRLHSDDDNYDECYIFVIMLCIPLDSRSYIEDRCNPNKKKK